MLSAEHRASDCAEGATFFIEALNGRTIPGISFMRFLHPPVLQNRHFTAGFGKL
jgi:hypothetical protein